MSKHAFLTQYASAIDREFEPQSGQTKDYEIGICYFSAKHAAILVISNHHNVFELRDMSSSLLLFQ